MMMIIIMMIRVSGSTVTPPAARAPGRLHSRADPDSDNLKTSSLKIPAGAARPRPTVLGVTAGRRIAGPTRDTDHHGPGRTPLTGSPLPGGAKPEAHWHLSPGPARMPMTRDSLAAAA